MMRPLSLLMVAALLLAPASATTLTVTLNHGSAGSVSEPLLVTAQVAASSLSSSQVSVSVTLTEKTGGTFSIAGATQTLTFTSNSTQTVTWSATPVQAGTFSQPFTATAKANSGSSSDAPGTATSAGAVTVSARPVLDIACASVPPNPTPGQTVDVTCTLSNPSGRNVTGVEACTSTSGDTLKVTVTSSLPTQTKSFTFPGVASINSPTPPCFGVGTVGSVFAVSWTAKTNPPNPPGPPGGGPSGGGAAAVVEKIITLLDPLMGLLTLLIEESEEKVIPFASKGAPQVLDYAKTAVSQIAFTLKESASDVVVASYQLAAKPKEVPADPSGQAHKYLAVRTEKIGQEANILDASIAFKVPKSALEGVRADGVLLQKYLVDEGRLVWKSLPTTRVKEDDRFVYFKSTTPGFSIFAIAGERSPDARVSLFVITLPKISLAPSAVTGPEVSLPGPGAAPPSEVITGGLTGGPLVGLGAAAIAGAAAVAFILARRRKG